MDRVEIVNMAAGELGDLSKFKRMTAFTRDGCGSSTALNVAFDFYQAAKEQMLAALDWARARKVKLLTVSADPPGLGGLWEFKYSRPPDCLVLRQVLDSGGLPCAYDIVNEERIENSQVFDDEYIYCNEPNALARYSFDLSEARYNVGMAQLHALYLAEHMAATVVGDNTKALIVVNKLQQRAERLCLALGAKEGHVVGERGRNELTDVY
jgi:hypothetical protein